MEAAGGESKAGRREERLVGSKGCFKQHGSFQHGRMEMTGVSSY
jgi:hypothetical protein